MERPARRAPRASQLSRVSFQPRGPDNSQSIVRARSDAGTVDFSGFLEDLFRRSDISCSMFVGMEKLASIVSRIAARLRPADEEIAGADDAAPCEKKPVRGSAGRLPAAEETPDVMAAGVLGKSAPTARGRTAVGACAADRGGFGAQIDGLKARVDSRFVIVGAPAHPGRAIAMPHAQVLPGFY